MVIDITWDWRPDTEYFGVPFDWEFLHINLTWFNIAELIFRTGNQILKFDRLREGLVGKRRAPRPR